VIKKIPAKGPFQVIREALLMVLAVFFTLSLVFATSYVHNFAIVACALMMWCSTLASLVFCIKRRVKGPPWDVSRAWFVVISLIGAVIPWAVCLSIDEHTQGVLPFIYAWIPPALLLILQSVWFCTALFNAAGASNYNADEHRKALVDVYTGVAITIVSACRRASSSSSPSPSSSSSDSDVLIGRPFMTGDTNDVLEL